MMCAVGCENDAACSSSNTFFMFSCCPDVYQDITKQVRSYRCRYFRIEKPPTCKLAEGTYRLMSEPEGEIKPQV